DERIHPVADATGKRAGHGRRMLRAYVRWLGPDSAAVAVLRLLGLFDRPARSDLLDELRAEPAIPGLTDALVRLRDDEWLRTIDQLKQLGLITREPVSLTINATAPPAERPLSPVSFAVDAHPLLREHFKSELREQMRDSWRAAHRRLYKYLCATTPDKEQPTLEDLQPLYQAIAHGCHAGLEQEVFEEIYLIRINHAEDYYSTQSLGAFASDLGALACFFEAPWSRVSSAFKEPHGSLLQAVVSFDLTALGRLDEAEELLQQALEIRIKHNAWGNAARLAANLSELDLILGHVTPAVDAAKEAVVHADRARDAGLRIISRSFYAFALHQAGHLAESEKNFREAEKLQAEENPQFNLLCSIESFYYSELLLAESEYAAWQRILKSVTRNSSHAKTLREVSERGANSLRIAEYQNWVLDTGLSHVTLGRVNLFRRLLSKKRFQHYNQHSEVKRNLNDAVNSLRRAGQHAYLIYGLLSRAWLRFVTGVGTDGASAQEDLDEAWQIAERGPMRLHMADIHLYRARLFFREKEYPWESPQADLAAARKLIEQCGYWRRKEELEDAERVILSGQSL
ncbi:MAG TPA: hypothetical protein VEV42_13900, partial [Pyrinomonadaceae bacterium]|nr:hypothetical protein [Pyrinomonadaceae bacterium]